MRDKYACWNVLFLTYLKRDWKMIVFWVLGLGGFAGGFVPAFVEISKGQGLLGMYETMKNPAMISMVGITPVKDGANYTIGAMYSHTMLLFCGLFAMIIAALHVVSHTRKEEENGLTEFLCSYRVGRHAGSFALMVEEVLIQVILAVFVGGVMASFGVESVEAGPAFLFGASVGLAGMMGAVIALVMAQIMPTSAGATGASLGITGILYLLRACTDIYDRDLSMINPMGWTYMTFPFTENNIAPLFFGIAFFAVLVFLSFVLEGRRDMGDGYLKEREGKGRVRNSLLSVPGLFFRLNRSIIISWLIVFLILGAAYGSIYGEMQVFLESNELIQMMFTIDGVSLEASFTSVIMVVLMGLTSILPVVVVNKLFTEETSSRMNQLFATKTGRGEIYWVTAVIAVAAGTFAILAAAGGLGMAAVSVMENGSMKLSDFLKAGVNYFPAVLFITSLAAVVIGWVPKFGKLLYVYIGYSLMLNYFHGILDLPEWFEKTAVLSWIPRMPVESFDGMSFCVIVGISLVLFTAGAFGYQKRDLRERA